MKCRYCNNNVPEESIFCMYCGERIARKKKTKKQEIRIPEPRQLKSGAWNIELRKEGESITEATPDACRARARAIRAGFLKAEKALPKQSLDSFLRSYIDSVSTILSPSTIRGYEGTYKHHFKSYMEKDLRAVPWQDLINAELEISSPKTVRNSWALITAAHAAAGLPAPKVKLPRVVRKERDFFDYEQILIFLDAVKGKSCELMCLLALHSLRASEILALNRESLAGGVIRIRGAVVRDKTNAYVFKEENKTDSSRRDVPVMIPRLEEIWPGEDEALELMNLSACNRALQKVCESAGLPVLTIHELRHSFASLAWHLRWDMMTTCAVGGWNDLSTVQNIYTHLAQKDKNDNIERMKAFYNGQFTNGFTNGSEKAR